MCLNTVARRVVLDPEATALATMRDIQAEQNEISKHEHISFSELQSEGVPVSSLFKCLFNFRNMPGDQHDEIERPFTAKNGRDRYVFLLCRFIRLSIPSADSRFFTLQVLTPLS